MSSDQQAPQDAPGSWLSPLDPRIVYHAVRNLTAQHEWTSKMASAAGCPVFKAEPGWHALFVTDPAAAAQVYNASPDEFDRDDGFLNSNIDYEAMAEGVLPTFMTAEGVGGAGPHAASRAFVRRAVAARGYDAFVAACAGAMDGLPHHAEAPELPMPDALAETTSQLMFKWYLGMDGQGPKRPQQWVSSILYTRGDSFPMNALVAKLKKRPRGEIVEYSRTVLDAIRASKFYGEYVDLAREVGMPEEHVAPTLLVSCMLNASTPPFAAGHPAIAQLYKMPALRERLAAEVAGVDDPAALAELPLLDAFFYESMRVFGKPGRTARKAMRDTTLTLGDGRVIKVPKGMSVQVVHTNFRDALVDDPEEFRPDRFLEDPTLKGKMYLFGSSDLEKRPTAFQCPGAEVGVSPLLWKVVVLPYIKDAGATIKEEYELKRDASGDNCTSPKNLTWVRSA